MQPPVRYDRLPAAVLDKMETKGKKFTPQERTGEGIVSNRILGSHVLADPPASTSYSLGTSHTIENIVLAEGVLIGRELSQEVTSPATPHIHQPQEIEQNQHNLQGLSESQWGSLQVIDLKDIMRSRAQKNWSKLDKAGLLEWAQQSSCNLPSRPQNCQ
ncbi:hypothetical protein Ndes2437B_g01001 [Nannochloris sp. 'desiccata']